MWIDNDDLRQLVNYAKRGGLDSYLVDSYNSDIERAEERERERKEKEIRDKIALCDLIYAELQKAVTPLCPTDIQFLIFQSAGREYSCSKIVHGLWAIEDFDSIIVCSGLDNLQHLQGRYKKIERHAATDRKDSHVYWEIQ